MGVTFTKGDRVALSLVKKAITKWHPHLVEAEVTVDVLFAHAATDDNGKSEEPALKLHGYPCAATIKINSYKQRVQGIADATITIDADWWEDADEDQRLALCDHEVTHLEVKRDDEGNIKSDDQGRPKLKMRLHDWQIGVFDEVIRRHGDNAVDTQVTRKFVDEHGQMLMAFAATAAA